MELRAWQGTLRQASQASHADPWTSRAFPRIAQAVGSIPSTARCVWFARASRHGQSRRLSRCAMLASHPIHFWRRLMRRAMCNAFHRLLTPLSIPQFNRLSALNITALRVLMPTRVSEAPTRRLLESVQAVGAAGVARLSHPGSLCSPSHWVCPWPGATPETQQRLYL